MHQILLTSNENYALKTFQNFLSVDLEPCRPEVKLEIFKPTFDKNGTEVIQKFFKIFQIFLNWTLELRAHLKSSIPF